MKLFRSDNTEGYSLAEIERLNKEWEIRVLKLKLEENTDKYDLLAKWFQDEVAKR